MTTDARVVQLGYIGLGVRNVAAWEPFATAALGLEVGGREADGTLLLRMDDWHHRIAVHPGGADDLAYAGWMVRDEPALEALGARLSAAGHVVEPGPAELASARRVHRLLRTTDPNGVAVELFCGPLVASERPFRSPRTMDGFVTGAQGVGHVVLHALDFDATLGFYRDLLGFGVSDYATFVVSPGFDVTVAFLHCNPRHHSLAFAAAPLPMRLNHVMLEVASLDDVGGALDACRRHAVPIAQTLGRHTNDRMVSFYVRSPSGFEVEYGWGARTVTPGGWQIETYRSASSWGHVRE